MGDITGDLLYFSQQHMGPLVLTEIPTKGNLRLSYQEGPQFNTYASFNLIFNFLNGECLLKIYISNSILFDFSIFLSQKNFPKFTVKESINDLAYLPLTGLKVLTCEDEAMSLGV
jgi:hypothetical protein